MTTPLYGKNDSGTPYYMAPEQILRETLSFGPWTDLYVVGCMMWELITGGVPYSGEINEIFRRHLQGVVPNLHPCLMFHMGCCLGWSD